MMTVRTMIGMYCKKLHHPVNGICGDCKMAVEYSEQRTEKCRFGKDKPICARCPVHCYKPEMRQKIREGMRYSGPRMIYNYPYLAFMHIIDKNRFKKFKINE